MANCSQPLTRLGRNMTKPPGGRESPTLRRAGESKRAKKRGLVEEEARRRPTLNVQLCLFTCHSSLATRLDAVLCSSGLVSGKEEGRRRRACRLGQSSGRPFDGVADLHLLLARSQAQAQTQTRSAEATHS